MADMVQVNLRLPRELYEQVRVAAFGRRLPISRLLVAAVADAQVRDFPVPEVNGTITEENGE